MVRFLVSTAAVALMTTAAFAADLPAYEPPPVVAPVPDRGDWSGFYIGIHGGYGWGDAEGDDFDFDEDEDDELFEGSELSGGLVGGQIGYNFQYNWVVFGVEGDGTWSWIDDDEDDDFDFDDDDDLDPDDVGLNSEIDYLASFRGRLGLGFDRFLIYGTGGVGFGGFSTDFESDEDDFDFDDDDEVESEIGIVYGGGAEVLVTDNVSIGAEYLHYDFGEIESDDGPDIETEVDVIRGRVNIKFNSLFPS